MEVIAGLTRACGGVLFALLLLATLTAPSRISSNTDPKSQAVVSGVGAGIGGRSPASAAEAVAAAAAAVSGFPRQSAIRHAVRYVGNSAANARKCGSQGCGSSAPRFVGRSQNAMNKTLRKQQSVERMKRKILSAIRSNGLALPRFGVPPTAAATFRGGRGGVTGGGDGDNEDGDESGVVKRVAHGGSSLVAAAHSGTPSFSPVGHVTDTSSAERMIQDAGKTLGGRKIDKRKPNSTSSGKTNELYIVSFSRVLYSGRRKHVLQFRLHPAETDHDLDIVKASLWLLFTKVPPSSSYASKHLNASTRNRYSRVDHHQQYYGHHRRQQHRLRRRRKEDVASDAENENVGEHDDDSLPMTKTVTRRKRGNLRQAWLLYNAETSDSSSSNRRNTESMAKSRPHSSTVNASRDKNLPGLPKPLFSAVSSGRDKSSQGVPRPLLSAVNTSKDSPGKPRLHLSTANKNRDTETSGVPRSHLSAVNTGRDKNSPFAPKTLLSAENSNRDTETSGEPRPHLSTVNFSETKNSPGVPRLHFSTNDIWPNSSQRGDGKRQRLPLNSNVNQREDEAVTVAALRDDSENDNNIKNSNFNDESGLSTVLRVALVSEKNQTRTPLTYLRTKVKSKTQWQKVQLPASVIQHHLRSARSSTLTLVIRCGRCGRSLRLVLPEGPRTLRRDMVVRKGKRRRKERRRRWWRPSKEGTSIRKKRKQGGVHKKRNRRAKRNRTTKRNRRGRWRSGLSADFTGGNKTSSFPFLVICTRIKPYA